MFQDIFQPENLCEVCEEYIAVEGYKLEWDDIPGKPFVVCSGCFSNRPENTKVVIYHET